MSKVKIVGNASGSGTLTLTGPNTNSDRTITLPDSTGTVALGVGISDSADATAITIDSSENVGIGVTPESGWNASYSALQIGSVGSLYGWTGVTDGAEVVLGCNEYTGKYITADEASHYIQYDGKHFFRVAASGSADASITWTTAMTIDNAGFVGINNTAPNAQLVVEDERSGSIGTVLFKNTHASVEAGDEVLRIQFSGDNDCTGGHFINFFDSGGDIGRVNCASASTVAYATSSDYRLKENVVDITTPITKLKALKPKSFNFIKTPSITQDGFLAHELADVVPIAVSGEKDATKVIDTYDEDGEVNGTETVIDSQGVDNSFVVPLLTGALQEAVAKIEELTTRIETLEAE